MKHASLCAALVLLGATAPASDADGAAGPVLVTPVLTAAVTAAGQPIELPLHDVRVMVSTYEIARDATLPQHKHPYSRYAYVLAGRLLITNTETSRSDIYTTGDFIIEAIGQWHEAASLGDQPVKLLVIDQVAGEQSNVVLRN